MCLLLHICFAPLGVECNLIGQLALKAGLVTAYFISFIGTASTSLGNSWKMLISVFFYRLKISQREVFSLNILDVHSTDNNAGSFCGGYYNHSFGNVKCKSAGIRCSAVLHCLPPTCGVEHITSTRKSLTAQLIATCPTYPYHEFSYHNLVKDLSCLT